MSDFDVRHDLFRGHVPRVTPKYCGRPHTLLLLSFPWFFLKVPGVYLGTINLPLYYNRSWDFFDLSKLNGDHNWRRGVLIYWRHQGRSDFKDRDVVEVRQVFSLTYLDNVVSHLSPVILTPGSVSLRFSFSLPLVLVLPSGPFHPKLLMPLQDVGPFFSSRRPIVLLVHSSLYFLGRVTLDVRQTVLHFDSPTQSTVPEMRRLWVYTCTVRYWFPGMYLLVTPSTVKICQENRCYTLMCLPTSRRRHFVCPPRNRSVFTLYN